MFFCSFLQSSSINILGKHSRTIVAFTRTQVEKMRFLTNRSKHINSITQHCSSPSTQTTRMSPVSDAIVAVHYPKKAELREWRCNIFLCARDQAGTCAWPCDYIYMYVCKRENLPRATKKLLKKNPLSCWSPNMFKRNRSGRRLRGWCRGYHIKFQILSGECVCTKIHAVLRERREKSSSEGRLWLLLCAFETNETFSEVTASFDNKLVAAPEPVL